jgi:ribose 1,5-bisphosphate isomerase
MSVGETAKKIKSMQIRGALRIAIAAVKALEEEIIDGATYDDLVRDADILRDARPTAVSLPNAVNYVIHLSETHRTDDPAVAKPMLLADVADYIASMEASIEKIADTGASLIEEGDVILTICNSDTVVRILKRAKESGKQFKVYACETRPRLQGHITVKELVSAGIDVTIIVDSAAYHTILNRGVKKVLVGADTVYSCGDVINKIGTSQVALIAKHAGRDFIVCTETLKFYPYSLHGATVEIEERDPREVADIPNVKVYNPAFDVTSHEHITKIVTEEGIITPDQVQKITEEKYSWMLK